MTSPGDEQALEITAAWPPDPHRRSLFSNMTAFQWDQDRAGVFLMFGNVALPVWLTNQDRLDWIAAHPDHRIPVEPLASVYMTEERATEFVKKLAAHLGLKVEPGDRDAS
jgi:hypothetical protein